uniref:Hairy/enhancer-of-split related with YRPW motif protein n=1 Tax=Timema shepardi TaxID=629360 RepID=A0A7R9AWE4_TIMSH|nr:unnamed protein product [Timema shepardi]
MERGLLFTELLVYYLLWSVTGTTRRSQKWRGLYPVHPPALANAPLLDCIPSGCSKLEGGNEGTALHAATTTPIPPHHPRLSSRRQRQTSSSGVGGTPITISDRAKSWRVLGAGVSYKQRARERSVTPLSEGVQLNSDPVASGSPTGARAPGTRGAPYPLGVSHAPLPVRRPLDAQQEEHQCSSPADGDSYQLLSRKKRRGIIEKRRRDRINTSLTELRRLVPAAYEKQGSAKLEKAEILQLTVDHLKMLHAKGMDVLTCDPHKFAMDYHNLGFRECASEVARYLVTVEGLDIQDPLRLRLMSHLQCFAAQRELATKQSSGNVPWSYGPADPGNCVSQHYSPPTTAQQPPPPPPPSYDSPHVPTSSSASSNLAASYSQSHAHAHYPSNPDPHHQTSAYSSPSGASPSHVKPYRPWGAELAY